MMKEKVIHTQREKYKVERESTDGYFLYGIHLNICSEEMNGATLIIIIISYKSYRGRNVLAGINVHTLFLIYQILSPQLSLYYYYCS